jgi:hypothetical protein
MISLKSWTQKRWDTQRKNQEKSRYLEDELQFTDEVMPIWVPAFVS